MVFSKACPRTKVTLQNYLLIMKVAYHSSKVKLLTLNKKDLLLGWFQFPEATCES